MEDKERENLVNEISDSFVNDEGIHQATSKELNDWFTDEEWNDGLTIHVDRD